MFNVVDNNHTQKYFDQVTTIANKIDKIAVEEIVSALVRLRQKKGRLFVLGVGGSAANAAHAVNDFRKLCGIETYAPTDNVSELTARTNDEGWETVFEGWLRISQLSDKDAILVFSVGGGNAENNVSVNIIKALNLAVERGASILGIV
ncbi:MAG: sugar isomerase, partial [Rhodospirillaceae bacterium]|nr:sugar isomerase [Rhodospirillaceae bacterium]